MMQIENVKVRNNYKKKEKMGQTGNEKKGVTL